MDIIKELEKCQDLALSSAGRLELLSSLNYELGNDVSSEIFFGVTQVSLDIKKDIYEVLNFLSLLSNYEISLLEKE